MTTPSTLSVEPTARWTRFGDACRRTFAHLLKEDGDLVSRWRARLTACGLLASITLGSVPFAVTMRVLMSEGRGALVVLHLAALLTLLALVLLKRVGHGVRSGFLIGSCAAVGTLALLTMGFISAGLVWLFASVLLAALLRSWQTTVAVLAYVLLLLVLVGAGIQREAFDWTLPSPFAVSRWPMIVLNFAFVVSICGGAISFAMHLLGKEDQARSAMEQRLAEARRHEALGTLSSGIAHDFNNLLVPLFSSIDELRRSSQSSPELRATLDDAAQGAALARDLVQRILAYAKQTELPRAPLLLAAEVRGALGLLRHRIPRGVNVSVTLDEAASVNATSVEVHEIITNLLENALHAIGPSGDLRITIERARAGAAAVVLTVSDTGIGMDESTRERIFDPYFTTRSVGRGTGLGLPIVRSIVHGLGGSLTVRSAPAQGSTFEIRLPEAGVTTGTATVPAGDPLHAAPHDEPPRPRSVLLVDDEPAVRRSVGRLLAGLGYAVHEADSSEQAVALLGTHDRGEIDVLLVDYRMPGDNGVALSAAVQQLRPGLPTVVMSGDVAEAQLDPDWQANAIALQKPFSRQELAEAITAALAAVMSCSPVAGRPRGRTGSRAVASGTQYDELDLGASPASPAGSR